MAKCWYLLGNGDGQNLENPRDKNQTSDGNELNKISWTSLSKLNVKYWNLEVENYKKFNTFSLIKQRQNLNHEYKLNVLKKDNISEFNFSEHMHEIDECRFILDGEIYYDIFDNNKQIIRIHLIPGDFIIIPKYHFHRTILPKNIDSVTFIQLTETPMLINRAQNDEEKKQESLSDNMIIDGTLEMKTYFMEDVQKNPKQFIRLMMESMKAENYVNSPNMKDNNTDDTSVNGIGYVMGGRAKALASYPHLREFNGMLFVSGTSSRRPDNTHIGAIKKESGEYELDIRKQTKAVLENIKIILGTVGAGLQHLLAITVFLVDFKDYQGMNEIYNEYFDGDTGPTRTTVAVARLPHPNLLIEIQATAAKPI